jgi:hypothetical protein
MEEKRREREEAEEKGRRVWQEVSTRPEMVSPLM